MLGKPPFLPSLLLPALLLLAAGILGACDSTTLSGRIKLRGNEPFTYTVLITEEEGTLKIVGPLVEEIRSKYQGNYLRVRGRLVEHREPPGPHRALEVLEILEVRSKPFDEAD
jgi:hypothetical protein